MMTHSASLEDPLNKPSAVTTMVGLAHLVCGIAALYIPNVLVVAPLAVLEVILAWLGAPLGGGLLLIVVGSLAIMANMAQFTLRVLLLLPQQLLLMLQIWSISTALVTGVYPDGYIPVGGPWFILTDQIWAWVLTVSHSVWLASYIYQGLKTNHGAVP